MAFVMNGASRQERSRARAVEALWNASVEAINGASDLPDLNRLDKPRPIYIPMFQKPKVEKRRETVRTLRASNREPVFHVALSRMDETDIEKLFAMCAAEHVRHILLLGGDHTPGQTPIAGSVLEFMENSDAFRNLPLDRIGLAAFPEGNTTSDGRFISVEEGLRHLAAKVKHIKKTRPGTRIYVITQYCSDPKKVAAFYKQFRATEGLEDVEFIVGVSGPATKAELGRALAKMAKDDITAKSRAGGFFHPGSLLRSAVGYLRKAKTFRPAGNYDEEGNYNTLGYVQQLMADPRSEGIAGVHLYSFAPLHKTARLIQSCAPGLR